MRREEGSRSHIVDRQVTASWISQAALRPGRLS